MDDESKSVSLLEGIRFVVCVLSLVSALLSAITAFCWLLGAAIFLVFYHGNGAATRLSAFGGFLIISLASFGLLTVLDFERIFTFRSFHKRRGSSNNNPVVASQSLATGKANPYVSSARLHSEHDPTSTISKERHQAVAALNEVTDPELAANLDAAWRVADIATLEASAARAQEMLANAKRSQAEATADMHTAQIKEYGEEARAAVAKHVRDKIVNNPGLLAPTTGMPDQIAQATTAKYGAYSAGGIEVPRTAQIFLTPEDIVLKINKAVGECGTDPAAWSQWEERMDREFPAYADALIAASVRLRREVGQR